MSLIAFKDHQTVGHILFTTAHLTNNQNTTAIALLDESQFPPATVLIVVALYRVISILAEAIAALIAWIIEH